jgi:hypothetical protein
LATLGEVLKNSNVSFEPERVELPTVATWFDLLLTSWSLKKTKSHGSLKIINLWDLIGKP